MKPNAIVIISNNATEKVIQLFEQDTRYKIGYYPERINSFRNINSNGNDRRSGKEIIVLGVVDSVPFPQADSIDKVIKILFMDEDEIKSNQIIANKMYFATIRQSSYYISALKFLGLVDNRKNFTRIAKNLRSDPENENQKHF